MRGFAWILILALSSALTIGAADDANGYKVLVKEMGVGDAMRVEKDETQSEKIHYRDPMGKDLMDRSNVTGEVSVYHETILAKERNQAPSRIKRTFDRAMKRDGKQLIPLAYNGRTVLIEKKNGKFHFWLTGRGELTATEAVLLDREFNGSDERFGLRHLLPATPVRPGAYPWQVNMAPLLKDLARTGKLQPDAVKCRGTGQMKRVWRDDEGRLQGEFYFELDMPLSSIKLGRDRVTLRPGAKGVSQMTIKLCIDGSSFQLVHKDSLRIEATGPYRGPDGNAGVVAVSLESTNKGSSQEIPSK